MRRAAGYGEAMGYWRAENEFANTAHAEAARAFEREYTPSLAPFGAVPVVTPTRRGLLRKLGDGALLEIETAHGTPFDASFVRAERQGRRWVELTSPSAFSRLLREQADTFLKLLAERAE